MFYVYLLYSYKDHNFYTGYTSDLKRRVKEHLNGEELSTKDRHPLELVYYEAYPKYKLAYAREYALKRRAKGWQELLKRLEIKM